MIFSFFKKEKEVKPAENKVDERIMQKEEWAPLGKHMSELKRQNQSKPKLLPLQDDKYKDKITLVLELDEVLIYSYEPDPKEMFMTAPMRYFIRLNLDIV